MKKENKTLIVIIIIVIAIIATIYVLKDAQEEILTQEEMQCIADNSKLIVSKTCSHCATQKQMLGNNLGLFELIEVSENPEVWEQYDLIGVPTWIIDEKTYPGVRELDELKEITNC